MTTIATDRIELIPMPPTFLELRLAEQPGFAQIGEHVDEIDGLEYLDFIHLVDKKRWQDKLISPTKEKSYAYLADRDYDSIETICASF